VRAAKGSGSLFKLAGGGYRGYVTVNGKRKYFTAKTKAEAAQKQRELVTRRESGALQVGKSPTVEQWLRHWIENVAQLRPTTAQTHTWVLERRIVGSPIARIRLDALTVEDIEQWLAGLGVKPSSARRYLAPLRAALTAAMKRGHLGSNPVDRMELPQSTRPRTTSLVSRGP
jgi:integrase